MTTKFAKNYTNACFKNKFSLERKHDTSDITSSNICIQQQEATTRKQSQGQVLARTCLSIHGRPPHPMTMKMANTCSRPVAKIY
eukprot:CAMPEP_0172512850 /NCGR_PEP_ID=MMETSP1066-20121228/247669_1 /TAXON_ID=671091 /ORGANISM="Coscinodiscus wailesii, Strain CCMP2513" /LENGTH=83 /DNA_ID=CAMNT_0013292831 /DNA_START=185 /DNA_END=436 /DNA_ORIENTATION=-